MQKSHDSGGWLDNQKKRQEAEVLNKNAYKSDVNVYKVEKPFWTDRRSNAANKRNYENGASGGDA
jgi:hypothetical protein